MTVNDLRTQFGEVSKKTTNFSDYLHASLNLMTADTRGGMTPDVSKDFAVVAAYSREHPDARRGAYVLNFSVAAEVVMNISPSSPKM